MQLVTPDVLLRQNAALPVGACAAASWVVANSAPATRIDEAMILRMSCTSMAWRLLSPFRRNDCTRISFLLNRVGRDAVQFGNNVLGGTDIDLGNMTRFNPAWEYERR